MNKKIGFIGCGNMGSAMVGGIIKSKLFPKQDIIASCRTKESANNLENSFGIETTSSNIEVVKRSDFIILAVKPYMYESIIKEIKDLVDNSKIIITIAAGITINHIQDWFNKKIKLVRTMPNTPALVGEGMTAICPNKEIKEKELDEVMNIFNSFGKCEIIEEKDFHSFIALSGSSPAYTYMYIEAMGDAGVKQGMSRNKAYKLAAQAILGAAKMVLETGENPGKLKDNVCSPGGTTIEAVIELEKQGFKRAVISAMEKCEEKSKSM